MKDLTKRILDRLDLYKDFDPYYNGLFNDCADHITSLQAEVDRLAKHNEQLLQVIYQNQSSLEEQC